MLRSGQPTISSMITPMTMSYWHLRTEDIRIGKKVNSPFSNGHDAHHQLMTVVSDTHMHISQNRLRTKVHLINQVKHLKHTAALSSNSWHLLRQSGAAANWTNVFSTSALAAGLVVSYNCLANSSSCTISCINATTT